MNIKERYKKLVKEISHHDRQYYVFNSPLIPDIEYDKLYKELQAIESQNPELITPNSPTQRLGDQPVDYLKKVKHSVSMLSLSNTFNEEDLQKWIESIGEGIYFSIEPKYDGLGLSLIYKNGILQQALTRGDGIEGNDVTVNAKTIFDIPLMLSCKGDVTIRGEVYMKKSIFKELNESLDKKYANTRNLAAGSLKQKNARITRERRLSFFGYDIVSDMEKIKSQSDVNDFLFDNNFKISEGHYKCKTIKNLLWAIKEIEIFRPNLNYDIDGAVIKVNDFEIQKKLGFDRNSPKWAIAYKFQAKKGTSKLLSVRFQVGRTGIITPVANIAPVEVGGVTITSVTLHNFDEIERLGIAIGDTVTVERAGDVIPKIVGKKGEHPPGSIRISPPTTCPCCNSETVKEDVFVKCPNPNCPDKVLRKVIHFASVMDIETFGGSTAEALIKNDIIKDFADIYYIRYNDIISFERFGDKKVTKLLEEINKSKTKGLASVLDGLGTDSIGTVTAEQLANEYMSLDKLLTVSIEELDVLPNIGENTANQIYKDLHSESIQDIIKKLKNADVKLTQDKKEHIESSGILDGKTFCLTGKLSQPRKYFVNIIESNGGKFTSVSSKLDYLIVGEKPGSKLDKARKHEVKEINEEQFMNLIQGQ